MDERFFSLDGYHILLVGCGLVIVAAYWLPRLLRGREPSASGLLILGGLLVFGVVPSVPAALDPLERPEIWERLSEFAVIIALFGTGLRIDRLGGRRLWSPTVRLLVVAMPLCILAVALLGLAIGMTMAGALLLAAVLAPTDPVLAGDVQVGAPHEGGEHPVRFALTTEAGLNDGLAFPFVYLAIMLAAAGGFGDWVAKWLGLYVVYKIAIGAIGGAVAGWLLGKVLFVFPRGNPLADSGSGVIALAGVLLTYGLTEMIEGYGFIAAFVMGLVLRRAEQSHAYHTRLHSFSEALEHAVTAIMLVMLGGAIPAVLPYLEWHHALIGLALVFLIRPISGLVSLAGTEFTWRERGVVAFFGVRGLGSIYYLAYAGGQIALVDEGPLWATVVFTILLSSLVHGFTAGTLVNAVTRYRGRSKRGRIDAASTGAIRTGEKGA
ncbi:sodium:proton antiporter [Croceicoccus ponticola]|uniref:Sodium:proton antiporter n=1 Tax=Croceicoccus ponticola TaxID=2217664 RepID=A0A437GYY9_9SPHN|nr:cation:proton antiporter [Croceicoccus ponticola]RVQ67670.1 sodium:proton antiporter [Croceicoccus ponticola]